jgi:RNA polymerase sigma factor (TIGR02999 family)
MTDVTRVLAQIDSGDPAASQRLLPLVYQELRALARAKLARERPEITLQATALVHEAYLRLVNSEQAQGWGSRRHFFAAAAEAMRRILINRARDKQRIKRGGGRRRLNLDDIKLAFDTPHEELLALDEALQILAEQDATCVELVKLRFFAGLSLKQAAELLQVSRRTADRHRAYA